ncbi:MAG TPA: hypothetical protein VNH18_12485, partial [Bryobacteraceae bacterium]|nr:hypothetical protein [Bryobacteraceae bacterium]
LHMEYSRLQAKLTDKAGADDAREAVALREKLAARYPAKEEYAQALASDYGNLSLLLMTAGLRDEARQMAMKTIEVRERNSARHPEDVILKRDLMMGYGRLGDLTGGPFFGRVGGDDKRAFEYYRKAVDVAAWVMKADANNQLAGADYATAMMRAGMVLPDAAAIPVSLDYLTRAAAIFDETLRKNPKIRFARANLGLSYEYMARRYEASGKVAEAVDRSRRALEVAQGMVKDEPEYASARINAMRAWDALVHILARNGSRGEALAEVKRALNAALDYAAHGPKPERMMLFPPEVRGWVGDVNAILAAQPGGGAPDWRVAQVAYQESLSDWKKLTVSVPKEAPGRVADLEKKIAECGRALVTLADAGRK